MKFPPHRVHGYLCLLFFSLFMAGCNTEFNFCLVDCKRVVTTSLGKVEGSSNSVVNTWRDIPYAATTAGDNRWRKPQPLQAWDGVIKNGYSVNGCHQWAVPTAIFDTFVDEDCLNLTIWAPDKPGPHPVMIWFHGGALMLGSSTEPHYIGANLARDEDVVVVNVSYRLGPMGFFSLPGLTNEQGMRSGNYGFYDQLEAIKWVNREIAAFGGDPDSITLFGESAGALSVCMHLVSPESRELFDRAIVASGPCGEWTTLTQNESDAAGSAFAAKMGCDQSDAAEQLACMRAISADDMKDKMNIVMNEMFVKDFDQWSYFPHLVIDGEFITGTFDQMVAANKALIQAGSLTAQPLIVGTVKDEGSLFEAMRDHPSTTQYQTYLTSRKPTMNATQINELMGHYPIQDFINVGHAMSVMSGDSILTCPTVRLAQNLTDAGYPVWHYEFGEYSESILRKITAVQTGSNPPPLGVFHSGEIAFLFGITGTTSQLDTAEQHAVSETIQGYMGALAHNGDPNEAGLPAWQQYDMGSKAYKNWTSGFTDGNALRDARCNFWITNNFFH